MATLPKISSIYHKHKKINQELQLLFLKRLHHFLEEGYSVLNALEFMQWDKHFAHVVEPIIDALKGGKTIDEALKTITFHSTITSYLYFIRINGDLLGTLAKCIEMFEYRMKYLKKFKQIIQYPLLLLLIFTILFIFMKQTILPTFLDLFSQSPEATTAVNVSIIGIELVSNIVFILAIGSIALLLCWFIIQRRISIEARIKIYLRIPIYRSYLRMQTTFHFATHLSAYLKTGMSMKEIVAGLSAQEKLPIIAYYAKLMLYDLENGFPLQYLLTQLKLLDQKISLIFQRNNDHRTLEKELSIYAAILIEELQRRLMKVLTLLQPIFFFILANFIILIYLSIMLPMFELIKTI